MLLGELTKRKEPLLEVEEIEALLYCLVLSTQIELTMLLCEIPTLNSTSSPDRDDMKIPIVASL
jgi:hypothetical protein